MAAYYCDCCEGVTPHKPLSIYEWQKAQAENAMERGGTEVVNAIGLWKLADMAVRVFDADQFRCQRCSALVQPKKSLDHYFYIPEGVSKRGRGHKIFGYEGFYYLRDILTDPDCLNFLRQKYNPDFLSGRRA